MTLGEIYLEDKQPGKAITILEDAVRTLDCSLQGDTTKHQHTLATGLRCLGAAHARLGQWLEARPWLVRHVAMTSALHPPDHRGVLSPSALASMGALAVRPAHR